MADDTLRTESAASDFCLFLEENFEALITSSNGGSIRWSALLEKPEIVAFGFLRPNGQPVTSRYARAVWARVKRRRVVKNLRQVRKHENGSVTGGREVTARSTMQAARPAPAGKASVPIWPKATLPVLNHTHSSSEPAYAKFLVVEPDLYPNLHEDVKMLNPTVQEEFLLRFDDTCVQMLYVHGPQKPFVVWTHDGEGLFREDDPFLERNAIGSMRQRYRSYKRRQSTAPFFWPPHWVFVPEKSDHAEVERLTILHLREVAADEEKRQYVVFPE